MILIDSIMAWYQRSQHEKEIQRRYDEFEADPAKHTRSPWIRSLVESPIWHEKVRLPDMPRKTSVTGTAKAVGRDYVLDMLRLERAIRFRHYRWAFQGIITTMADDLIEAVYAEERERIYRELLATCADENLCPGCHRSVAQVQGMVSGVVARARRSL